MASSPVCATDRRVTSDNNVVRDFQVQEKRIDPAVLYGTASLQFTPAKKMELHHSDAVHRRGYQRSTLKRITQVFTKCITCCHKETPCQSAANASNNQQLIRAHAFESASSISDQQYTQDHDRDRLFQSLVSKVGREKFVLVSSQNRHVFAQDIDTAIEDDNLVSEIADADNNETFLKQHGKQNIPFCAVDSDQRCDAVHSDQRCDAVDSDQRCDAVHSDQRCDASNTEVRVDVIQNSFRDAHSVNNTVSDDSLATQHSFSDLLVKTAGNSARQENTLSSNEAENVKTIVQEISAGLNKRTEHQEHSVPSRTSMRGNVLHTLKSSTLSYLYSLRYFQRLSQVQWIQMMNDLSQFCYPRFAEREARSNTLANCANAQLCGHDQESLANAGWFFNHRTLITFCCGMEFPPNPQGHPADIHFSFSPHCEFALALQSHLTETDSGENQSAASEHAEEFKFSIPVAATDDGAQSQGAAASEYESGSIANGIAGLELVQESKAGGTWMTDGAGIFVTQTTDTSYLQNIATNRPDLDSDSEQLHRRVLQNTGSVASNAHLGMSGPMLLRSNDQNPLSFEDTEPDFTSPPFFNPLDQLNYVPDREGEHQSRYPQFGVPALRIITFEGWPRGHAQTRTMLADAGLFYAGYGDSVLCYSCGIGLRNWLPTDDPWIEHARWQPSCTFVRTMQGQHFVDAACEMTGNNNPSYQQVRLEANHRRRAAETGSAAGGQDGSLTVDEIAVQNLCKVCYSAERSVILMPCHHLAVCQNCRVRIVSCPLCHCEIETSFQARFA